MKIEISNDPFEKLLYSAILGNGCDFNPKARYFLVCTSRPFICLLFLAKFMFVCPFRFIPFHISNASDMKTFVNLCFFSKSFRKILLGIPHII